MCTSSDHSHDLTPQIYQAPFYIVIFAGVEDPQGSWTKLLVEHNPASYLEGEGVDEFKVFEEWLYSEIHAI